MYKYTVLSILLLCFSMQTKLTSTYMAVTSFHHWTEGVQDFKTSITSFLKI